MFTFPIKTPTFCLAKDFALNSSSLYKYNFPLVVLYSILRLQNKNNQGDKL